MKKRSIALLLSLALVAGVTATAPASEAKGVKLSKKKLSITVGKTAKLSVKKAKKKVKWSSSKKAVAKITKTSGKKKNTAVIKGVKKGTAKITAKVGKKKAVCKVTVKAKATTIKSVGVDKLDESCLTLTFKKAKALNLSSVTIVKKDDKEGTFNKEVTVKAMTGDTTQKTYRLYTNSKFYPGDYVKVTVGKESKQVQYAPAIVSDEKGSFLFEKGKIIETIDLDYYFGRTIGDVKYSLKSGKLPEGLEIVSKRGLIKGIPTTVGDYDVVIKATDEFKRTEDVTLHFGIYDETVIKTNVSDDLEVRVDDWAEAKAAEVAQDPKLSNTYRTFTIKPKGASGKYQFSLQAPVDVAGVKLSTDPEAGKTADAAGYASTDLVIPYGITPGTHTYTLNITDAKNPAVATTATVTVDAVKYYNISGTAKDVQGANLSGNEVYFYDKDSDFSNEYEEGYKYYKDSDNKITDRSAYDSTTCVGSSKTDTTIGKQEGTYSAELPEGTYIVKVYSGANGVKYHMDTTVTVGASDGQMLAITAPVRFYSVMGTAAFANGTLIKNQRVYFELKDEKYEYNERFSVETNENGQFIASLPSNTYSAYIMLNGSREYFTSDVTIKEADVTLSSFALSVNRTVVSGQLVVPIKSKEYFYEDHTTGIYFFNNDNDTDTSEEDYTYVSTGKGKLAESANPDETYNVTYTFADAYLENGTYYAKFQDGGEWYLLGTFTVNGEQALNQSYTFNEADYLNAATVTVEAGNATPTELVTGSNLGFAKINVPNDGNYEITVSTADAREAADIRIFNTKYVEDNWKYHTVFDKTTNGNVIKFTSYLNKGTNYLSVEGLRASYDIYDDDYTSYYVVGTKFGITVLPLGLAE